MEIATSFEWETRCKREGFVQHPCDMTEHYAKKDQTCHSCGRTDTGLPFPKCEWYKREYSMALAEACERSAARMEKSAQKLRGIAGQERNKAVGWEEMV